MVLSRIKFWACLIIGMVWLISPSISVSENFPGGFPTGQLTQQEKDALLKKMQSGEISPEQLAELQNRYQQGTLTPEEIEQGKKLLEGIRKEPGDKTPDPDQASPAKEQVLGVDSRSDKPEEKEPRSSEAATPLEIFGHNLFSSSPSTFAPIQSVPVSNDYTIGPGDEIQVLMWGRLDSTYNLEVDNEGIINFPKVGPLAVAGLSFGELKELIRQKAESITGVNVSITMGRLRTIQVFVLGEVKSPGVYTISALATVTNALLSSGGPSRLGSLRKVQLKRQGKVVSTIDLYDFLLKGDITSDSRLMPGDVIFVPQCGPMVSVSGNVKRPAIYELKHEKGLERTLNLAGGLAPQAFNQRIQVERAERNQKNIVLDIPFASLQNKREIALQDGDVVKVFPLIDAPVNAVYLYGNVKRPGRYAFKDGLCLIDVLVPSDSRKVEEYLGQDTYFNYALVKRYRYDDMRTELIPFDLGALLFNKEQKYNIPLEPLDEIHIFNKSMFQDKLFAEVEGEIRQPGKIEITKGMRLKNLFFKAGFFTRDAYMEIGHLYRTAPRTREVTIHSFNVEKALAGDPANNLLLSDMDRILIHNVWEYKDKYTVQVRGQVNNPGEYPYADNMMLKDLLLIGGNVKNAAYMDEGELVRYEIIDGRKLETTVLNFNVRLALQGDPAHNFKLQPMDVVQVKEIPEWWDEKRMVTVKGEVLFPGTYQIRKDERLSDLIARCGGFTEHAYLRGAFFTREEVRKLQQKRLDEMVDQLEIDVARFSSKEIQSALSEEDVAAQAQFMAAQKALLGKLKTAEPSGRVVVKMLPLELLRASVSDIILESGDQLFIPQQPNTVNVLGAVYNPSALIYDGNKPELKHYLAKTGGPTRNADEKGIYIMRADGTVVSRHDSSFLGISWNRDENRWGFWGGMKNAELHPGDTVLVPERIVKPSFMKNTKDFTQVLYQIAVGAGVVIAAF